MAPPAAGAAAPTASAAEEAAALFRQGKQAYAANDYEGAYRAYSRAWELWHGFDIGGNYGNICVKTGRYRESIRPLQYVLGHLPPSIDGKRRAEVVKRVRALLDEALAHVALVRVMVAPEGAEVSVDGVPAGKAPLEEIVLDPGKHVIAATLDGYQPVEQSLELSAGSRETLRMTLVRAGERTPAAVVRLPEERRVEAPPSKTLPAGAVEADTVDAGPSVALIVVGALASAAAVGTAPPSRKARIPTRSAEARRASRRERAAPWESRRAAR